MCVAVVGSGRGGEVRQVGVFENRLEILCKMGARLAKGGRRLSFCHDADPCGYGLHYLLTSCGHSCIVVAPSLIPMKSGDRVKTDRSCEGRLGATVMRYRRLRRLRGAILDCRCAALCHRACRGEGMVWRSNKGMLLLICVNRPPHHGQFAERDARCSKAARSRLEGSMGRARSRCHVSRCSWTHGNQYPSPGVLEGESQILPKCLLSSGSRLNNCGYGVEDQSTGRGRLACRETNYSRFAQCDTTQKYCANISA